MKAAGFWISILSEQIDTETHGSAIGRFRLAVLSQGNLRIVDLPQAQTFRRVDEMIVRADASWREPPLYAMLSNYVREPN